MAPNEKVEVGTRRLLPYRRRGGSEHIPGELHEAHALVADELEGVIDTIRRSFTCQFHPELMADIRDIGKRDGPRYAELKDNDGVRLLVRLLYHGMQE